ncbi:phenylacetate--CoA ligase family protein [Sedimenticola thiotaurini]|uniref:Capsule biosynthesis protein CapK n=1 Tax=Sedimenticola thiotaurini TaxID=1543721 RepID=A0A0F7JTA6_9GAMM|nr:AMP-binding protein [Sedimenticola thiotaurini]AKH19711.1 capsule biosynthesis protein CapK [Sedimenticola thiotaurini]
MSLYTKLVSNVLFPLHEQLKGHNSVAIRKALEQSQWWSREQINAFQSDRLKQLIADVYQHVPYYRELMDQHQIKPAEITSVQDLRRFPFLTKQLIKKHTDALKADTDPQLQRFNTGGSTGEPLIFYIGKERVSHDVAAKWRATRWWGVDIGDPEIVVWGSPVELGAQDRIREIRDKLLRTELMPAFEMSDENLDRFVEKIRQSRPTMLFGYPSALSLIARHAKKHGVAMDNLGIKVAFVTSERLYEEQKKEIESIFGCPTANGYGGRDGGFIAHQCPAGNMHITAEDIIVEIVDSSGEPVPAGEAGEVVVTHLATREFPFIRYRTGDVAVMDDSTCPCGRGLPVLKEIQGRTTDFIVTKSGVRMHGLALIYILRDIPSVKEFQIIQESVDSIRVKLVVLGSYGEQDKQSIVDGFKLRLGDDVEVILEQVDKIEAEKSGKFRYVKSQVVM